MRNLFKRLFSVLLVCVLLVSTMSVCVNAATATLLNTYGALFGYMGTCINSWQLQDANTLAQLKTQYNSITLENEMKPDAMLGWSPSLITQDTAKSLGYYVPSRMTETYVPKINFDTVDAVLKICAENGLKMRAHTLVWHAQTPDWFFRIGYSTNYGYVSQSDMDARMEYYIKTVMNHVYTSQYADVVYAWDVVNEYQHATDCGWLSIYGGVSNYPSFVKNAFQYAYDCISYFGLTNSVSLFYNDFNTYMEVNDIITMVNYINSNGKICDGVGMQSHVGTTFPSVDYYTAALTSFLNAGFEVQITELDISNSGDVDLANYAYQLMTNVLNLKKNGANITGITYWGLADNVSWVSENNPLLFTTLGNPKYAYYRVLDAYTDAGFVVGGSSSSSSSSSSSTGNLVTNGGIEDGTSNWEALYGCTLGLGYSTVKSGNLSLKVSNRNGTYQGASQTISGFEKGATYDISAALRYNSSENSSATGETTFILSIMYGDGSVAHMATVSTGYNNWATMNGQYTVPSNADLSSVKIYFETSSSGNSAQDLVTFFIDDVSITKAASSSSSSSSSSTTVTAATIADGWYTIKNTHAQKYLQATDSTGDNGVNVDIYSGINTYNQKWYVKNVGDGYITLQNATGTMLDVTYGSSDSGTNIQTYSANGATAQQFKLVSTGTNGTYGIVTRVSGDAKGLDVYDWQTAENTNVCQWDYYGSANQTWVFESCESSNYALLPNGWYYIKSPYANKYLQVANNAGGNGVNVEISSGTGVAGQKWYLTNVGDGYITLKNGQGYMLDVIYGENNDGTNIQTYSANGASAQQFMLKKSDTDGRYGIVTRVSDGARGLDIYNWGTSDGVNVCQWAYYGNDNQVWVFESCN